LIVYVCAIGAYAINNSTMDIWYMLIFGVVGYFCKKLASPIAPMVLALVLGDMAESALRQSLTMSQGSPLIFVTHPISAVLVVLSLGLFVSPVIQALLRRWR
jgi:putative tricarboxylic transport membrane protein